MSILLSAYFPEGIVFAADKNATLLYDTPQGAERDVEVGVATKVVPWAYRRAVVGHCGLGRLAGLSLEEWMRQFAAKTRDFTDLEHLATQMREEIQRDFDRDFPPGRDVEKAGLIIHLGGFRQQEGIWVPAMFYLSNVPGLTPDGGYTPAVRTFSPPRDDLRQFVDPVGPQDFRTWLETFYDSGKFLWFNNGLYYPAFNLFKESVWRALVALRASRYATLLGVTSLSDRVAYCRMAIDLFDSFFRHHFLPRYRSVGGGSDAEWIPWPEPASR